MTLAKAALSLEPVVNHLKLLKCSDECQTSFFVVSTWFDWAVGCPKAQF